MTEITCFKAYDVRGRVPDQLNEAIARRVGRAYAQVIEPRQVVVGHDIRLSSEAIKTALVQGLVEQGVDVYDIGLCGTEEIYFATSHAGMDDVIAVTASDSGMATSEITVVRTDNKNANNTIATMMAPSRSASATLPTDALMKSAWRNSTRGSARPAGKPCLSSASAASICAVS